MKKDKTLYSGYLKKDNEGIWIIDNHAHILSDKYTVLCSYDIKYAENSKADKEILLVKYYIFINDSIAVAKIQHDKEKVLDTVYITGQDIVEAMNYGAWYVENSLTETGDMKVPRGNALQWLFSKKGIL